MENLLINVNQFQEKFEKIYRKLLPEKLMKFFLKFERLFLYKDLMKFLPLLKNI